jgi:ApaG protein
MTTEPTPQMYRATTNGVTVEVFPIYQIARSQPEKKYYYWSFDIVIHNLGDVKIYLTSRHWVVHDENNKLYEIHGSGVNGTQPIIKGRDSFTHTSGCPLATPSGRMRGVLRFIDHDRAAFDVRVPEFPFLNPTIPSRA